VTAYLLLSHTHGLLPLALRLKREGHPVEHIPWRHRYEKAWEGAIETGLKGERKRDSESLAALIALANDGQVRVLADHPRWLELFGNSKDLWATRPPVGDPSVLRACGWWDGEHLQSPHLLVVDLGAWPGGQGALVEGGATLVRGWEGLVRSVWEPYLDALKSSGHRGLVQAHLGHGLDVQWWSGGWTALHLHAWLSALETPVGVLLEGLPAVLPKTYTVVVPVTVPPWPVACDQHSLESEVLAPKEALSQALWHDTRVVEGKLLVAGLDGLVAVARGSAHGLGLARTRALAVATSIRVPQRQLRGDVGGLVERTLAHIETAGWSP
jgi:hypothetical protein